MAPLIDEDGYSFPNDDDVAMDHHQYCHDETIGFAPLQTSSTKNFTTTTTTTTSTPNRRQRRRRNGAGVGRVSFLEVVAVFNVMNLADYSEQELRDTWYGRKEQLELKQMVRSEAKLYEWGSTSRRLFHNNNTKNDDDDDGEEAEDGGGGICGRGLESRTRDGAKRKSWNRRNANAAVFFEQMTCQDEERYYGVVVDDDATTRIADAYRVYSAPCLAVAQSIAQQDAIDAQ